MTLRLTAHPLDLVLDVRFLQNPYFVPALKKLPGTDPAVIEFVMGLTETKEFLDRTNDLLSYLMPRYEREGKSYLTIAIGCTGGQHRSVYLVEALRGHFERSGHKVMVRHRELP